MTWEFALGFVSGAVGIFAAFCFLLAAYRAGQKKGQS